MDLSDDLPRPQAAAPADAGRLAARRRPRHRPAARGRRRRRHRHALALRGADHPRAAWRRCIHIEVARRVVRRGAHLLPEPASRSTSGPSEYLEHLRKVKQAVSGARHRLAQRRHARAAGSSTRKLIEQAGADALELNVYYVAHRPAGDRAPQIEQRDRRDGAGGASKAVTHPGRGQALAVLLLARPLRAASSTRPAPTASSLFNRFYQPDIDVEALRGASPRLHLSELGRAAAARCAGSRSCSAEVKASLAAHRRRPHRPRRGQGGHGRRPRRADRLGAARATARRTCAHRCDRSSRSGSRSTSTSRSRQAQGSMNLEAVPRPGGLRARQLHARPAELAGQRVALRATRIENVEVRM